MDETCGTLHRSPENLAACALDFDSRSAIILSPCCRESWLKSSPGKCSRAVPFLSFQCEGAIIHSYPARALCGHEAESCVK